MTNSEQRRLTNWRLKVLQAAAGAGNVARTCRHFGISRKTFYKWRQRYQEHGDAGLADRARAPTNHKYRRHAHRWTRYEKAQPGHRLQVDVKFLERIPGHAPAVLSIHGDR